MRYVEHEPPNNLRARLRRLTSGLWLGFLGMFATFGSGLERVFRPLVSAAMRALDATSRADSMLDRLLKALFWPLTAIGRGLNWMGDNLPVRWVGRRLYRLFRWLCYPLVALWSFLTALSATRRRELLYWSIPLLLAAAPVGYIVWQVSFQQRNLIGQRYRQAITAAIERGDFQQANLFLQKLQQMGTPAEQFSMQTAEDLARAGKIDQAMAIAEQMGPLDKPGFAAAHFWQAQMLIDGRTRLGMDEALKNASAHLTLLRQSLGGIQVPPEVDFLEAVVLLKRDQVFEALTLLDQIADQMWAAAALKLEVDWGLNRLEEAKRDGQRLVRLIKRDPRLIENSDPQFFRSWASAVALSDDREEWRRVVSLWHEKYPQEVEARRFYIGIQLNDLDLMMVRGRESDFRQGAEQLASVARLAGETDRDLIALWLNERLGENRFRLPMAEVLSRMEPTLDLPPNLLEALGTVLIFKGELSQARQYLARAVEGDPQNALAWNNYAYAIHRQFPDELELALAAANRAVALRPNNYDFRETRGAILNSLGRWQLAVDDLQIALQGLPNSRDVHSGLAQAYGGLGETTLAEMHQRLAQRTSGF